MPHMGLISVLQMSDESKNRTKSSKYLIYIKKVVVVVVFLYIISSYSDFHAKNLFER